MRTVQWNNLARRDYYENIDYLIKTVNIYLDELGQLLNEFDSKKTL